MKIACVIGARPNYMKVAPVLHEIRARHEAGELLALEPVLIHTGQHYDRNMNEAVLEDLRMPPPAEFLGVGGGTHAVQTAKVMMAFDDVCERHRFDAVLVVGDVNSTLACALVARKRGLTVMHVEAGLRSFDSSMPEEINRVLTDQISDVLFITSEDAKANLAREGVDLARVRFVGNPMIDSLRAMLDRLPAESPWKRRVGGPFAVVTLHRPSNVDSIAHLAPILGALETLAARVPTIFPVHPRTAETIRASGIAIRELPDGDGRIGPALYGLPPLAYRDFLDLLRASALVITDSGGIQEETTVLGIPCITVRPNTERPVTIELGTNELVPSTTAAVLEAAERALGGGWKQGRIPPLWDGRAASRIVDVLGELVS